MSAVGYSQPMVRTGYETMIAQRTSDTFAFAAESDGVVSSIKDKGIIVTYADGVRRGVELGRIFGHAEGSTYPHDIVTLLKEGDKFKKGDVLAYNTGFFEPDFMNPKNVIWRSYTTVKTALYETTMTHEDSSSISKEAADRLTSKVTKLRSIVVNFDQGVRDILKVGGRVSPSDFLCIIEDATTNITNLLDEAALETLKRLSNKAPKAKYTGTLDRIEVLYHGDKEDMSESLRAIANLSDRNMNEIAKSTDALPMNGSVNNDYRVAGTPLALDTAEIKFYVTITNGVGVGDKGIFGNQLKTTFGEVFDHSMTTESGAKIDALFGATSLYNRIVCSPFVIGTGNTLLKVIAQKAVEVYSGK